MQKSLLALITLDLCLLFLTIFLAKKKRSSGVVLSLFVLLFLILLAELCYVTLLKDNRAGVRTYPNNLFTRDQSLGYRYAGPGIFRSVRSHENGDTLFDAQYTIMADTFRTGFSFDHRTGYSHGSNPSKYIFVGCSFTFGEGVNDKESLPWLFGLRSQTSTINMGCSGYGTHQVYYLLKNKLALADNTNNTVVYSFLPDHIYRAFGVYSWNTAGPFYGLKNESIFYRGNVSSFRKTNDPEWIYQVSVRGALSFIRDPLQKKALAKRIKAIDSSDVKIALRLIDDMSGTIANTGGRMVILYWDLDLDRYPPELIRQLNSFFASYSTKYKVIRVSSIIKGDEDNFIRGDGHPTAKTNEKIAEALVKELQKN